MTGAIETLEDVTERKQVEQALADRTLALQQANENLAQALDHLTATQAELVRKEKLAALGAMVAGVAHELNTPIGNAVLSASALRDSSEEFRRSLAAGLRRSELDRFIESTAECSNFQLRNLDRAARLIDTFKKVAVTQQVTERSEFQLAGLVAGAVKLSCLNLDGKDIRVLCDIPEELELDSFPGELEQILISLLDNAITHGFANRERGEISIAATRSCAPGELVIELRDDGNGIANDILPRIFDPFFTTRLGAGGSGLGLNIVYNQVTAVLGGRIEVSSSPETGTCFRLFLPQRAP